MIGKLSYSIFKQKKTIILEKALQITLYLCDQKNHW